LKVSGPLLSSAIKEEIKSTYFRERQWAEAAEEKISGRKKCTYLTVWSRRIKQISTYEGTSRHLAQESVT
jgi:hypothetical protein